MTFPLKDEKKNGIHILTMLQFAPLVVVIIVPTANSVNLVLHEIIQRNSASFSIIFDITTSGTRCVHCISITCTHLAFSAV